MKRNWAVDCWMVELLIVDDEISLQWNQQEGSLIEAKCIIRNKLTVVLKPHSRPGYSDAVKADSRLALQLNK